MRELGSEAMGRLNLMDVMQRAIIDAHNAMSKRQCVMDIC